MIVSLFHVTVPAEAAERFEQSWTQRAGQVDKMPGFKGLESIERWRDAGTLYRPDALGNEGRLRRLGAKPGLRARAWFNWRYWRAGWRPIEFFEVLPS